MLNFALNLEQLENAFYAGALVKYSEADFASAGLPPHARGRFAEVTAHDGQFLPSTPFE